MRILIFVAIAVILGVLALEAFVTANPARLARRIKILGGLIVLAGSIALMMTGLWFVALPGAALGMWLLGSAPPGGFSNVGGGGKARISTVRSAMLEMQLDHETGNMTGRILAGAFEGEELDELSDEMLDNFHREVERDPESLALFEAYLDRRSPGWREHVEEDRGPRHGGATHSGAMTDEEAYEVLGLAKGAPADAVRDAHRRLMKRLHPDHGGSDFLAAKINEAKDRLLR